jgi:hypothetical protein
MPAGDVYKVRTRGTMLGQNIEFGVHLKQNGAAGSAADIAASWVATIVPLVVAATSVQCNWTDVVVSDTKTVAQGGLESVTLGITQPSPGAVAGDVLPGQNAAVVSLRTGRKGGRFRGRFYVPGIAEASQAQGILGGAQLTAIQALAAGLLAAYGAGGTEPNYSLRVWSPEVLTFPAPKVPKPRPGVADTAVESYVVDQTIRTQRRRAIGVGR